LLHCNPPNGSWGIVQVQPVVRSDLNDPPTAVGGIHVVTETQAAARNQTERETFDSLRKTGFDALYSLDYDAARNAFKRITELFPDHPAGYLYLGTHLWLDYLNRNRRLQTGLYINPSFYAESEERIDEGRDRQFRQYIQQALDKAEAKLAKDKNDVETRYFLGAAYGLLAGYESTVARRFFSALSNGKRAVKEHREVVRLNPNYADAYLTIGLYDYVVGSLPLAVKIIAALGGMRGSRERGIRELEQAAQSGRFIADDARVLLIALYFREGRFNDALHLLDDFAAHYPKNYLFRLEKANLLMRMGRKVEAVEAFDALLDNPQYHDIQDLIRYEYGESLFQTGYAEAALSHFRKLVALESANAQLQTLGYLRIGQALDLRGEREAALTAYQTVLRQENVFDSHKQAERFVRRPCTRAER
jgi:tetratricopeptide (TPR) repeat protein